VPDLILLDINMPYMDGLQAVTEIRKKLPNIKVVFISMYHDAKIIAFCKQNNINGYLPKDITSNVLKSSIDSVIKGDVIYLFEKNLEKQSLKSPDDNFIHKFKLSPKEIEIIHLIKKGLTSKQIGQTLFSSEFTIETHRKNIFRKLNVKSVGALVQFANDQKL
jgi:DNA-binding NarL/FixJ family response regulator